jgi:hypothetical protein
MSPSVRSKFLAVLSLPCVLTSSWLLANVVAEARGMDVESLAGGQVTSEAGCSNCTIPAAKKITECLHRGNTDPCSTITCINNYVQYWSCNVTPSKSNCKHAPNPANWFVKQTLSDGDCVWTSNTWTTIVTGGGACQGNDTAKYRCLPGTGCDGPEYEEDDQRPLEDCSP